MALHGVNSGKSCCSGILRTEDPQEMNVTINAGVYGSSRKTVFIPICALCILTSRTLICMWLCMVLLSTSQATCVFHVSVKRHTITLHNIAKVICSPNYFEQRTFFNSYLLRFGLQILEEEKLQENSKIVGTNLLLELAKLQSEFSVIGDVRGKGLMIGIELVKPGTKEALPADKFSKFFEACMNMGLLLGKGGINGNVLRIQPPMCITKDDADFTITVMRKAFQDL